MKNRQVHNREVCKLWYRRSFHSFFSIRHFLLEPAMRYSIAALSLVSPALALPTLPFLSGGLFGGHGLLSDLFSHGQDSSYAEAPAYNGGPTSYGSESGSTYGAPSDYGSGPGYNSQESAYGGTAPQGSGISSSVVDAASASTTAPEYTNSVASGYGVASARPLYNTTTAPGIVPTTATPAPAASSSEISSSSGGQTCESPDIVGCETASGSSASEVAPDSVGVYDFIICGGGTAGLVIANRLSENTDISVAVIEAGDLVFNNKNVSGVDGYGLSFGTAIDWQYESTPQAYAGNKSQTMRAGKALGGTSTINGRLQSSIAKNPF